MQTTEVNSPMQGSGKIDQAVRQWAQVNPQIDTRVLQLSGACVLLAQQIEIDFRALANLVGDGDVDLGPGELRILLLLRRSGPSHSLRGVDLLNQLLITSGAIAKQLGRLEGKGLIARTRSSEKRGRLVQLTDKGVALADRAIACGDSAFPLLANAFSGFSDAEQAEGLRFIRRLLGKVEFLRKEAMEA